MRKLICAVIIAITFMSCSTDSIVESKEVLTSKTEARFENKDNDPILNEAYEILLKHKDSVLNSRGEAKVLCHSDYSQPSGTACVQTSNGSLVEVKWQTYLVSASNMATEIGYTGTVVNACTSCGKASKEGDVDYQDIFDNPTNDPEIQSALETIGRLRRFQLEESRGGARVLCQTNYSSDFGSACVLTESGKLIKVKWTTSLYTPFLGGVTTYTGTVVETCGC